jgi:hypothetical protein
LREARCFKDIAYITSRRKHRFDQRMDRRKEMAVGKFRFARRAANANSAMLANDTPALSGSRAGVIKIVKDHSHEYESALPCVSCSESAGARLNSTQSLCSFLRATLIGRVDANYASLEAVC